MLTMAESVAAQAKEETHSEAGGGQQTEAHRQAHKGQAHEAKADEGGGPQVKHTRAVLVADVAAPHI